MNSRWVESHLRNVLQIFYLWIWFWFSINVCTSHSWRALSRLAHLGREPNWVRIPKKVFYSICMTKSLFNWKEKLFGTRTQCGARALVCASFENARQLYQVHSLIESENQIQKLKHHSTNLMSGLDIVGARFQDLRALRRARQIECVYQKSLNLILIFNQWVDLT